MKKAIDLKAETTESGRHYLLPNDEWVPSVTTILGFYKTDGLKHWREAVGETEATRLAGIAASRGSKMHDMFENELMGYHTKVTKALAWPDMQIAYRQIVKKYFHKISNIRLIESCLYSETEKIAGRCDLIADFYGEPAIIDFKNSSQKKPRDHVLSYYEQASLYSLMYEELYGEYIENLVVMIACFDEVEAQILVQERKQHIDSALEKVRNYPR